MKVTANRNAVSIKNESQIKRKEELTSRLPLEAILKGVLKSRRKKSLMGGLRFKEELRHTK